VVEEQKQQDRKHFHPAGTCGHLDLSAGLRANVWFVSTAPAPSASHGGTVTVPRSEKNDHFSNIFSLKCKSLHLLMHMLNNAIDLHTLKFSPMSISR
jgi:hypothetical protein